MMMNYLTQKINEWGHDKGILPNPDAEAQFKKTAEEVAELQVAIEQQDKAEVVDAIGDIYVTLVMQCNAWDVTMDECVQQAYTTIAQRTGKMVDGQFVKD